MSLRVVWDIAAWRWVPATKRDNRRARDVLDARSEDVRPSLDEEWAARRKAAENPSEPHDSAVSLALIGHTRHGHSDWSCSCGHRAGPGESFHFHQADEVLALLKRRGWRP